MTSFDTIFPEIRDRFRLRHKLACTSQNFIEDTITYLVDAKCGKFKYAEFIVLPETIPDHIVKDVTEGMEKRCVKPIWRINQKRVAHGLESWF